jgi:hypothetical protein
MESEKILNFKEGQVEGKSEKMKTLGRDVSL